MTALLPTAAPGTSLRHLLHLAARTPATAAASLLALLGAAAAGAAIPALLGRLVDLVLADRPSSYTAPVAWLLAAGVLQAALTAIGLVLLARTGERALARLREDVVASALQLPQERLEQAGTGDLLARVSGDQEAVSTALQDALPALLRSALAVLLTLAGLAALDLRLALAGCAAVPLQAVATRRYLRVARPRYAAERIAVGARVTQLEQVVHARRTLQALNRQARAATRAGAADEAAVTASRRAAGTASLFGATLNIAELVGLTAVLTTGWWLVDSGQVTVGAATAAALYFVRLFDPVMELLYLLDRAQDAGAAAARLVGVAILDPPVPADPPAVPTPCSVGLHDLHFAYLPGRPVLDGVRLTLPPGSRTALVGRSGAGKSTLAAVLAGLHEPTRGTVTVDGLPTTAAARHQLVALVTQDVHVFSGTLRDDLRTARPGAGDAELLAALEAVGADWALLLPDGLDTRVGDGGRLLDPTRAQHLALTRLHLHPAPVVVLDEATAEAGSAGARTLEAATLAAIRGRTALLVAHRLTVAAAADQVVVLEHGQISQQGTHDELRRQRGAYAQLWQAWSRSRD